MAKQYRTAAGVTFDTVNYIVLTMFGLAAVLPFVYVIAGSFASDAELTSRAVFFIPKTFTLNAYEFIFSTGTIVKSIGVSVYVTVIGTLVNLFFTVTMAYSLAKRGLYGRNLVLNLVIFSMLFGGGMIPTYLVVKELQLLDSLWALMLPGAISAFNLIIVKNFFRKFRRRSRRPAASTAAPSLASCGGSCCRCRCLFSPHLRCFMPSDIGTISSRHCCISTIRRNGRCRSCCARSFCYRKRLQGI